jgi:bifunctional non-homologous end joining protein LigD
VILPHLHGRPASVKRYPNGVEGKKWWERDHRIDDLPTLLEFANKAAIELHPVLALADAPERPTFLVFDLDPGPPAGIELCCKVARALRGMFSELGLESFAKTSGGKGMQVYVPLNTPTSYDVTRPFARGLAELLERRRGELVVSDMKKSLRGGKVFVDWSQNTSFKTTVNVYSLRAMPQPTVSTPLRWEEVEAVTGSRDPDDLVFTSADVLDRVAEHGDLFAPVAELRQSLPESL